ncbi:FCD domain-containing protein [Galbitalea sp. SE-J8]|uniref:FadR/GntR family transcriptional regulator n=1 Tax=Galbitalea sp. SE-J8 TaxID=3054952 RepID=UPI00259CC688|nr:FCD domain-containing protein [Galbitalea sp. SE-J8]MDM4761995.1 FCD domain-containing protein [Galbitalea sp. SE-J8]
MSTSDGAVPTALDEAVGEVQHLVVDRLSPGDQLPSEAELAESIGVSRLTVREAIKVLAGRGLLEIARGRRAVVRPVQSDVLSDYLAIALRRDPRGLLELTAVRRALEVLSVGDAARLGTDAALLAVASAYEGMAGAAAALDGAVDGPLLERYHRSDMAFHAAVALASGNRMLALVLDSLASCLHESFAVSARGHFARGGTIDDDLGAHEQIAAAVRDRNAARAELLMRRHLDQSERDLRIAMRTAPARPASADPVSA